MSFTTETVYDNEISFLDVNVIYNQGTFTTNIYRKPAFSCVFTHFDSFLTKTYKFGMIYTLLNRCF